MQVLMIEDDIVMQELLTMLVHSQNPSVYIHIAETVDAGLKIWREKVIDLILCDWHLPGQETGLELVKIVRDQNTQVPIIMITGKSDRATVVNSLRHRVNEFIVKPFDPEEVATRLNKYLQTSADQPVRETEPTNTLPTLAEWAADLDRIFQHLSIMSGTREALSLLNADSRPSVRELAREWENDPAITTRMLRLANSSLMRRHGKAVNSLLEAVSALGVDMAISQVLAASMSNTERLQHPHLKQLASKYADEVVRIAERAAVLAKQLRLNITLSYTAGLMVRLGDLALLDAIQHYLNAGGQATTADMDAVLASQANRYGNHIKIKWHLPLELRERVGATYTLTEGTVNPELIVMRVAACQVHDETNSPEFERLVRKLGLEPDDMTRQEDNF
ncbi:MAG TPA: HDOD domain-containing protein [Cellvibrionaceae bacterium]